MKKYVSVLLPLLLLLAGCEGWPGAVAPLTQPGEGKPVKTLTVTDPSDGETITITFEYDTEERVIKMTLADNYNGEANEEYYTMSYNGSTVIIKESLYGKPYNTYTTTLNAQGRATEVLYTGPVEGDRITILLTYNAEGQLIRETSKKDYTADYTWTAGDLTHSRYSDTRGGYGNTDFRYSEYENRSNIDLNWIFSGAYSDSWVSPLGMLDMLGARSAHYAVPDLWDMVKTPQPGIGVDELVCEDLIGTTRTNTYTTTWYDEAATESRYDFDPDGDLTAVSTSTPVYRITYEQVGTLTIVNPDNYIIGEDGKKYYGDVELKLSDPKETGREEIAPNRTEITVEY